MRARLKDLHSPDVDDLARWMPDDTAVFSFLLQAMIGPSDADGAESFEVVVCSPGWLAQTMLTEEIRSLENMILMSRYDYPLLMRYVLRRVQRCEAPTWQGLAQKLGRFGKWEFEDYVPSLPDHE